MSAVLKFQMSGREFAFDGGVDVTADELWALDELGVSEREITAALGDVADGGDRPPPARVVRVFCALAYICARREDPATTWAGFARTIAPGTLELLGVEPSGLGAAFLAEPEAEASKPKRTRAKKPEKAEESAPEPVSA